MLNWYLTVQSLPIKYPPQDYTTSSLILYHVVHAKIAAKIETIYLSNYCSLNYCFILQCLSVLLFILVLALLSRWAGNHNQIFEWVASKTVVVEPLFIENHTWLTLTVLHSSFSLEMWLPPVGAAWPDRIRSAALEAGLGLSCRFQSSGGQTWHRASGCWWTEAARGQTVDLGLTPPLWHQKSHLLLTNSPKLHLPWAEGWSHSACLTYSAHRQRVIVQLWWSCVLAISFFFFF